MTERTQSHFDVLEGVIDQSSINQVILKLAHICIEKAEHVRVNWQDEQLAKAWERNASILGSAEAKLKRTF